MLRVRRDRAHLLTDLMNAVLGARTAELKRPMRVVFRGEEGIDAGGLRTSSL